MNYEDLKLDPFGYFTARIDSFDLTDMESRQLGVDNSNASIEIQINGYASGLGTDEPSVTLWGYHTDRELMLLPTKRLELTLIELWYSSGHHLRDVI